MLLRSTATASPADRLGLAVFLATVLHVLIILGVGFNPGKPPEQNLPSLDVTLVQTSSKTAPKDADYLAQANQDGSGNVKEQIRPQNPKPEPLTQSVELPTPNEDLTPQTPPDLSQPLHRNARDRVEPETQPLSAAQLIDRSMEIASLSAELSESVRSYAQRPREKRIFSRTREYKYASYMNDWITKVERIGTLNFPDEARRRHLSGSLLLDVALNADGSINNIAVLRPSGHRVLDDAALRIVRMAAPYAPFPDYIRRDYDVLHIIRTWEFLSNNQLSTK
ncbi:MAG: periplasmic protein TonB [Proteobacteria bacterium]|nr:periplasmic protein TonB [Pseudomonadota bacterium]